MLSLSSTRVCNVIFLFNAWMDVGVTSPSALSTRDIFIINRRLGIRRGALGNAGILESILDTCRVQVRSGVAMHRQVGIAFHHIKDVTGVVLWILSVSSEITKLSDATRVSLISLRAGGARQQY